MRVMMEEERKEERFTFREGLSFLPCRECRVVFLYVLPVEHALQRSSKVEKCNHWLSLERQQTLRCLEKQDTPVNRAKSWLPQYVSSVWWIRERFKLYSIFLAFHIPLLPWRFQSYALFFSIIKSPRPGWAPTMCPAQALIPALENCGSLLRQAHTLPQLLALSTGHRWTPSSPVYRSAHGTCLPHWQYCSSSQLPQNQHTQAWTYHPLQTCSCCLLSTSVSRPVSWIKSHCGAPMCTLVFTEHVSGSPHFISCLFGHNALCWPRATHLTL
jgi:hypothetical protein